MPCSYQIMRASELACSQWSGGSTTQLAIYPRESSYANRNFLWRISTATVEEEESTFTRLEGVFRHLMVLKGELSLLHSKRYGKRLSAFEQDSFWGDWETTGKGRVTDFNLMLRDGCNGCIDVLSIAPQQAQAIAAAMLARNVRQTEQSELLYFMAPAEVRLGAGEVETLLAGDALIRHTNNDSCLLEVQNKHSTPLHIARASVVYQPTFAA